MKGRSTKEPMVTSIRLPLERVVFHPEDQVNPFAIVENAVLTLNYHISADMKRLIHDLKVGRQQVGLPGMHRIFQRESDALDMIRTVPSTLVISSSPYHDSLLLEYVAASIGCAVGSLHTFTAQPYTTRPDMVAAIADKPIYVKGQHMCPYARGRVRPTRIVSRTHLPEWHEDLLQFTENDGGSPAYKTPEFYDIHAVRTAYAAYQDGRTPDALQHLTALAKDSDIRFACEEWLLRRWKL